MRQVLLCAVALAALLAGCSGQPAADDGLATDDVDAGPGRESVRGEHSGKGDNTTRVLDVTFEWQPDATPPPASMDVPANATTLRLELGSTNTQPCGVNWGDSVAGDATASFTAPSGTVTDVRLAANVCNVQGVTVFSSSGLPDLDPEPGLWQVTFTGHGFGLQQHLSVLAVAP